MTNCKDGARNDINMGEVISNMKRGMIEHSGQRKRTKNK